jgi:dedicator of cytokinesis protein 6/7/8
LLKIYRVCKIQDFEIDFDPTSNNVTNNNNNNNKSDTDSLNNESVSLCSKQNQNRISWLLTDLDKSEPDPIMPHLFERVTNSSTNIHLSNEIIDNNELLIERQQRPQALFNFYPPQSVDETMLNNVEFRLGATTDVLAPPGEHLSNRLLVKCTQLKFELEIEPIWATMALYDLKEKRKCSENFSFDLNADIMKQMLNTHQTHQDTSTMAKACIFNITYPSPDLFIVIRVEKMSTAR